MNKLIRNSIICLFALFFAASAYFAGAHDTCLNNSVGTTYCSKYSGGGIVRDSLGQMYCGKGQCIRTNAGRIRCSKVEGGKAVIKWSNVKCQGGCEKGTKEMCVVLK